ncbi:hypothetical protein AAY473_032505 [Plecturocebus cupreus]
MCVRSPLCGSGQDREGNGASLQPAAQETFNQTWGSLARPGEPEPPLACLLMNSGWQKRQTTEWGLTLVTSAGVPWDDLSCLQPLVLGSNKPLTSASQVLGTTGVRHYAQLIFVFLVETGFSVLPRLVSNSLSSSDLPASSSQSAGIMSVSHCAQAKDNLFNIQTDSQFFRNGVSFCPQAGMQWCDIDHCNLRLLGSSNSPTPASQVAGITGTHYHAQVIFAFFVEMGFHHVGQVDLELLTSGDPPASASQSARVIEMEFLHVGQAGLELLTSGVIHPPRPPKTVWLCLLGWSAVSQSQLTTTSAPLSEAILPLLPEELRPQACATTPS